MLQLRSRRRMPAVPCVPPPRQLSPQNPLRLLVLPARASALSAPLPVPPPLLRIQFFLLPKNGFAASSFSRHLRNRHLRLDANRRHFLRVARLLLLPVVLTRPHHRLLSHPTLRRLVPTTGS